MERHLSATFSTSIFICNIFKFNSSLTISAISVTEVFEEDPTLKISIPF